MSSSPSGVSLSAEHAIAVSGLRDEAAARARLKRNRAVATGLLGGMGVLFAGSFLLPGQSPWVALLRAGSEAGIVGGVADWSR